MVIEYLVVILYPIISLESNFILLKTLLWPGSSEFEFGCTLVLVHPAEKRRAFRC